MHYGGWGNRNPGHLVDQNVDHIRFLLHHNWNKNKDVKKWNKNVRYKKIYREMLLISAPVLRTLNGSDDKDSVNSFVSIQRNFSFIPFHEIVSPAANDFVSVLSFPMFLLNFTITFLTTFKSRDINLERCTVVSMTL